MGDSKKNSKGVCVSSKRDLRKFEGNIPKGVQGNSNGNQLEIQGDSFLEP